MSTATLDAIDVASLVLIGVVTPLVCFGGIGWAYRIEQRGSVKKSPGGVRRASDDGAERHEG